MVQYGRGDDDDDANVYDGIESITIFSNNFCKCQDCAVLCGLV